MKLSKIILFTIIFLGFSAKAKDYNNDTLQKRNYQLIINKLFQHYSKTKSVSLLDLQNAIPISQEEFSIYYSFTYPDKGKSINKKFYEIDNQIIENAKKNKAHFLILYLQLSPFVDGEYAEGYYDDIDSIIIKNKSIFCKIYGRLSDDSKIKLKEYKERYCK